jgi:hypothetical protein
MTARDRLHARALEILGAEYTADAYIEALAQAEAELAEGPAIAEEAEAPVVTRPSQVEGEAAVVLARRMLRDRGVHAPNYAQLSEALLDAEAVIAEHGKVPA